MEGTILGQIDIANCTVPIVAIASSYPSSLLADSASTSSLLPLSSSYSPSSSSSSSPSASPSPTTLTPFVFKHVWCAVDKDLYIFPATANPCQMSTLPAHHYSGIPCLKTGYIIGDATTHYLVFHALIICRSIYITMTIIYLSTYYTLSPLPFTVIIQKMGPLCAPFTRVLHSKV